MANTNNEVVEAWRDGRVASNGKGTLVTSGRALFSYQLCIGFTDAEGRKIAFYARAPHNYYSQTTSSHAGRACRVADETVTSKEQFEARRELSSTLASA